MDITTSGGPRGSSHLAFQLEGPASDLDVFLGTLMLFFRRALQAVQLCSRALQAAAEAALMD